MSEKDCISIGDRVDVHFTSSASLFGAEVKALPEPQDASWILKTQPVDFPAIPRRIVYVLHFERMDLVKRKSDDTDRGGDDNE